MIPPYETAGLVRPVCFHGYRVPLKCTLTIKFTGSSKCLLSAHDQSFGFTRHFLITKIRDSNRRRLGAPNLLRSPMPAFPACRPRSPAKAEYRGIHDLSTMTTAYDRSQKQVSNTARNPPRSDRLPTMRQVAINCDKSWLIMGYIMVAIDERFINHKSSYYWEYPPQKDDFYLTSP